MRCCWCEKGLSVHTRRQSRKSEFTAADPSSWTVHPLGRCFHRWRFVDESTRTEFSTSRCFVFLCGRETPGRVSFSPPLSQNVTIAFMRFIYLFIYFSSDEAKWSQQAGPRRLQEGTGGLLPSALKPAARPQHEIMINPVNPSPHLPYPPLHLLIFYTEHKLSPQRERDRICAV